MATVRDQIQADWENREFVEALTGSVKKLAEFLNNFGKNFIFMYIWLLSSYVKPLDWNNRKTR